MRCDEGVVRTAYLNALSERISSRYSKGPRSQRVFHAISDLWRIFTDTEINDEITESINKLVFTGESFSPVGLGQSAVNDLLSACLLVELITPTTARSIRNALFARNDLHGVMRGDLFATSSTTDDPVCDMVLCGGFYPGIFRFLQMTRESAKCLQSDDPDSAKCWNDASYIPSATVRSILNDDYGAFVRAGDFIYSEALRRGDLDSFAMLCTKECVALAQYSAWQQCPVILKFDPLLLDALARTSPRQLIPVQVLQNLPYWSVAVQTPNLNVDGVEIAYLMLSIDAMRSVPGSGLPPEVLYLQVMPYTATGSIFGQSPISYSLHNSTNVQERIAERTRVGLKHAERLGAHAVPTQDRIKKIEDSQKMILTAGVQIALYLCSDEPDYGGRNPLKTLGRNSTNTPLPSQKLPHEFVVGQTVASSMRKALSQRNTNNRDGDSDRATMRPHWRAAHYNLYWTGKGRTIPRVKWIAPTPVNVATGDRLPPFIREVDNEQNPEISAFDSIDDTFFSTSANDEYFPE